MHRISPKNQMLGDMLEKAVGKNKLLFSFQVELTQVNFHMPSHLGQTSAIGVNVL